MASGSVWIAIAAGIIAIIGLIVNLTVDRDNIFDMTTSGLFVITLILAFVAAGLFQRQYSRLEKRELGNVSQKPESQGTTAR